VIPRGSYGDVTIAQFFAGVMLSYGGLLFEVLAGGASGLTTSDPGLVKILGGFVFPVGLVMYVRVRPLRPIRSLTPTRIVLQGHELLTSNMMVRPSFSAQVA
jgi:formate/nitrite transporter FocA (FNT family)